MSESSGVVYEKYWLLGPSPESLTQMLVISSGSVWLFLSSLSPAETAELQPCGGAV